MFLALSKILVMVCCFVEFVFLVSARRVCKSLRVWGSGLRYFGSPLMAFETRPGALIMQEPDSGMSYRTKYWTNIRKPTLVL